MSNLGNKEIMSKNIIKYMEMHRETRRDLCSFLNVPYTTVTNWVKANTYPRIDKIEMMAAHWGINKSDLVEEKSAPISESGLSEVEAIYNRLSPDNRAKLLELARLYLDHQRKSGENG